MFRSLLLFCAIEAGSSFFISSKTLSVQPKPLKSDGIYSMTKMPSNPSIIILRQTLRAKRKSDDKRIDNTHNRLSTINNEITSHINNFINLSTKTWRQKKSHSNSLDLSSTISTYFHVFADIVYRVILKTISYIARFRRGYSNRLNRPAFTEIAASPRKSPGAVYLSYSSSPPKEQTSTARTYSTEAEETFESVEEIPSKSAVSTDLLSTLIAQPAVNPPRVIPPRNLTLDREYTLRILSEIKELKELRMNTTSGADNSTAKASSSHINVTITTPLNISMDGYDNKTLASNSTSVDTAVLSSVDKSTNLTSYAIPSIAQQYKMAAPLLDAVIAEFSSSSNRSDLASSSLISEPISVQINDDLLDNKPKSIEEDHDNNAIKSDLTTIAAVGEVKRYWPNSMLNSVSSTKPLPSPASQYKIASPALEAVLAEYKNTYTNN